MKAIIKELWTAALATIFLAIMLCFLYPLSVWCMAQLLFPYQAGGSLLTGYDAAASGGSNLGPLSKKLLETVRQRVAAYRLENGLAKGELVPADAITASASGLDPHISIANAFMQAPRIAEARGMSLESVQKKYGRIRRAAICWFWGSPG